MTAKELIEELKTKSADDLKGILMLLIQIQEDQSMPFKSDGGIKLTKEDAEQINGVLRQKGFLSTQEEALHDLWSAVALLREEKELPEGLLPYKDIARKAVDEDITPQKLRIGMYLNAYDLCEEKYADDKPQYHIRHIMTSLDMNEPVLPAMERILVLRMFENK